MKKTGKYCFVFLFQLSLSFVISAQTDYAVSIKGDTIRGTIKKSLMGKVRLQTTDGKIMMDPDNISIYYDSDDYKTYCSRHLPGRSEPVFITRLIEGPIKMYSYTIHYNNDNQRFSTTTWYAEKENIPLHEIKAGGLRSGKDERKAFFRSLIADNPGLAKRFDDDDSLNLSFLKELIIEYNNQAYSQRH